MQPAGSHILDVLEEYLERYPAERAQLDPLFAALDAEPEPTDRTTLPGHITCSAVVIDRDRRAACPRRAARTRGKTAGARDDRFTVMAGPRRGRAHRREAGKSGVETGGVRAHGRARP